MNELIEQMAAKAPAGPPCPSCGRTTRLVVFGEQWCSRCKVLRPCAEDPRMDAFRMSPSLASDASATPARAESPRAA